MKSVLVALSFMAALAGMPASAGSPADSPLAGRWILDVASLPIPPEIRPKSATLEFRDAGGGKWSTSVEIVDQAGKTLDSRSTLSLDGTPGKPEGTYWVDLLAAKMPAPNVLVMQFVYEKIPRSTRVYSVGADRDTLTETEAYFKDDGTPFMRTAIFTRAPD